MKKLILSFALMMSMMSFAQSFEGEIFYKNTVKSKVLEIEAEKWLEMLGSEQHFYIKRDHYKSETNGKVAQWQLYDAKSNKIYTKPGNSEVLLWNDAAINNDVVIKSEVKAHAAKILGYDCDEIKMTCKSGIQTFYVSAKLAVDYKLYEKHAYGNWSVFLKQANGLSLKTIIETPQFIMEQEAVEIQPRPIDEAFFKLPANAKSTKNPY